MVALQVQQCFIIQIINESVPMMDTTELVAEHLLELVPIQGSVPVSVQGRLHEHVDLCLNELHASSFVKDIVTRGYTLLFLNLQWPVFKLNRCSTLEHQDFVSSFLYSRACWH